MKQVYLVPMSLNEKDNEEKINEAILKIGKDNAVTWLAGLIKALDANKYMLVAEKEDSKGTDTPEIGVKVIRGSQDMRKTEDIINDTLLEMEIAEDEPKSFISICHPSEYMYIILFEYKAAKNPRVKIVKNPANPVSGSRSLSMILQLLDEDDKWGLQPYDSFMLDDNNMIILFSEE
jgi:hypothetical protein